MARLNFMCTPRKNLEALRTEDLPNKSPEAARFPCSVSPELSSSRPGVTFSLRTNIAVMSSSLSRVETAVSPTSPSHGTVLPARSWWWLPEIPGAIENGKVPRPGHFKIPVDSSCLFPPLLPMSLEVEEDNSWKTPGLRLSPFPWTSHEREVMSGLTTDGCGEESSCKP